MSSARVDLTESQISSLSKIVDSRISTNESVLIQHSRDESAFPPVLPSAVIYPKTTEEVSKVLSFCNENLIPVVAFGAGTSLEGHVLPLRGGISLNMTEMNQIINVSSEDLTATVMAGVTRVALNNRLAADGLFFSVDPGADATLGGMASTGAAGTTTVKYGSMRENVLGLTAVLANGTIVKTGRPTRKLSAGYDLTRLIVGSEGTLAVITEITLRLFGIPEKMSAAIVRFPTLSDGVAAAARIVQMGTNIARCEFLDEASVRNANKHSGLSLPEQPTLLFEFHGSPTNVESDARGVSEIVKEFNGSDFEWTSDETQRRRLWQARHDAYWSNVHIYPGMRIVSTDMAVPLSSLAEAVAACNEILSRHTYPFSIFGHVADGNFHCMIITDPRNPNELSDIREITHALASKVISMNGTCTGEHGIGMGKIESLVEEAGINSVQLMREIKLALDPNWILNPDKVLTQ